MQCSISWYIFEGKHMKRAFIILSLLSLFGSSLALATEVQVSVNGMVCGFCAQGIKKKFSAQPAVDEVKVSLEKKLVTLSLKEGQDIPNDKIAELLKDSGYSIQKIVRK